MEILSWVEQSVKSAGCHLCQKGGSKILSLSTMVPTNTVAGEMLRAPQTCPDIERMYQFMCKGSWVTLDSRFALEYTRPDIAHLLSEVKLMQRCQQCRRAGAQTHATSQKISQNDLRTSGVCLSAATQEAPALVCQGQPSAMC